MTAQDLFTDGIGVDGAVDGLAYPAVLQRIDAIKAGAGTDTWRTLPIGENARVGGGLKTRNVLNQIWGDHVQLPRQKVGGAADI